jgi:hypothetical protein
VKLPAAYSIEFGGPFELPGSDNHHPDCHLPDLQLALPHLQPFKQVLLVVGKFPFALVSLDERLMKRCLLERVAGCVSARSHMPTAR